MVDDSETTLRDRRSSRPGAMVTTMSALERSVDVPIDDSMLIDSVKLRAATTTLPDAGPSMEPSSTRLMRAEASHFDPTATIRTHSSFAPTPSRPPPRTSSRPPPRMPSRFPRRSSVVPDPSIDVPTKIHRVPVELLSMSRTTAQRFEESTTSRMADLGDTDECPTADLSDAADLEWLDD